MKKKWANIKIGLFLVLLFLGTGCSDETQQVIDHATGKEQVGSYQKLQNQIEDIRSTTEERNKEIFQ